MADEEPVEIVEETAEVEEQVEEPEAVEEEAAEAAEEEAAEPAEDEAAEAAEEEAAEPAEDEAAEAAEDEAAEPAEDEAAEAAEEDEAAEAAEEDEAAEAAEEDEAAEAAEEEAAEAAEEDEAAEAAEDEAAEAAEDEAAEAAEEDEAAEPAEEEAAEPADEEAGVPEGRRSIPLANSSVPASERAHFSEAFELVEDGRGHVLGSDVYRLLLILGQAPGSEEQIVDELRSADIQPETSLTLEEFLGFVNDAYKSQSQMSGELREAFQVFDKNGDGFLDCREIRAAVFGVGRHRIQADEDEDFDELLRLVDRDNDGRVNYAEFCQLMTIGVDGLRARLG